MPERSARWYNKQYRRNTDPRPEMMPIFNRILGILKELEVRLALDIGCGLGTLMTLCLDKGIVCNGFDFSSEAIGYCKAHGLHGMWVGDARDEKNYQIQCDAYLATEVMEHVKKDFKIIEHLRPHVPFIFSVPEFMSSRSSHVRRFRSESEILERYSEGLNIQRIEVFGKRRLVTSETK